MSHVTRHTSHVTRHKSHLTRHTSHITRHTSHVTRHTSLVTRHLSFSKIFQCTASGIKTPIPHSFKRTQNRFSVIMREQQHGSCCCAGVEYLRKLQARILWSVLSVTRHTSHVTRQTSNVKRHTSHVTRHTSHVTRHTSHVTRHTSHVTRHTSHVTRHLHAITTFYSLCPAASVLVGIGIDKHLLETTHVTRYMIT